jgi:hypothetical protein
VWDLRFESRPLVLSHQQQRQQQQGSSSSSGVSGDVWHVQFDVLEAAAASPAGGGEQLPGVLLCTEDGCMARAAAGPSGECGAACCLLLLLVSHVLLRSAPLLPACW